MQQPEISIHPLIGRLPLITPKNGEWTYTLNQILRNWGEKPAFIWYDKNGRLQRKILEER